MGRLVATITQGGADAFVQATMETALTGQTKQAYKVLEIQIENANANSIFFGAGVAEEWEIALSRRSKAAIPEISDVDVIKKFKFGTTYQTAVGQGVQPDGILLWQPPAGLEPIVVEDPLYIQLDSNATGLTHSAIVVVTYELVTISEVDRLNLIAQSLLAS